MRIEYGTLDVQLVGDTIYFRIAVKDSGGDPYKLNGIGTTNTRLTIASIDIFNQGNTIYKDLYDGISIVNSNEGILEVVIPSDETLELPRGQYTVQLQIEDNLGRVETLFNKEWTFEYYDKCPRSIMVYNTGQLHYEVYYDGKPFDMSGYSDFNWYLHYMHSYKQGMMRGTVEDADKDKGMLTVILGKDETEVGTAGRYVHKITALDEKGNLRVIMSQVVDLIYNTNERYDGGEN